MVDNGTAEVYLMAVRKGLVVVLPEIVITTKPELYDSSYERVCSHVVPTSAAKKIHGLEGDREYVWQRLAAWREKQLEDLQGVTRVMATLGQE